jgi:hypothetical protein
MSDRPWARVRGPTGPPAASPEPSSTLGGPYSVTIRQRDPPQHSVTAALHDKVPTPSEGGGGWEEVPLPKRGAVLIWRGRGLMKQSFSVIFDRFATGQSVIDDTYQTLLRFWRPEGAAKTVDYATVEPSILKLFSPGDAVPYKNLSWIISNLEWGEAQGDEEAQRTQQVLTLTFTEYRADERLRTAASKRTKPYTVKPGDTLAKIAGKHHISAKALGELQKPPIKDNRQLQHRKKIVVPVP